MTKRKYKQLGLTLIEIMVVIVIMAILAAIVVPKIMSRPEQAKKVKVKQDIARLEESLDLYKLDNGFYPSQEQGLQALVKHPTGDPEPQNYSTGGYIKKLAKDPWGYAYLYKNPGEHGEIDIYSLGPKHSTKTIIGNWDASKQPSTT
jgi:general secretion pathway protein G